MNKKICIMTLEHKAFDTRIFHREAKTLSGIKSYQVFLIAPHNREELSDNVHIISLPFRKNKLYIFLITNLKALIQALRLNAHIYHLHEPYLIPVGLVLKLLRRKQVIYDVHENYTLYIGSKKWIPSPFRKMARFLMYVLELSALLFFDKIVIAGEDIGQQRHFRKFAHKIVLLRNFPLVSLPYDRVFPKTTEQITFIYSGGLSEDRGILEIIRAFKELANINAELILLGEFQSYDYKKRVISEIREFSKIKLIHSVPYDEMWNILSKCHVGLICFKPTPNNIGALSGRNNKIYEYMQSGLAVIGSNFPVWKNFIEGNQIGVVADPTNIFEIKHAMEYLISNPEKLKEMQNRAKSLANEYLWEKECEKLLKLYE
jgi:glycosyltransferase involved in cell wall biosynthesis